MAARISFRPRWGWHLSLLGAWLLACVLGAVRPMPRGAAPMDVMLVARKPRGATPRPAAR